MPYSLTIPEEELKNKVAQDYFQDFDSTKILGKIDFCIAKKDLSQPSEPSLLDKEVISFLWAEAKSGTTKDIYESFVQLILTIGKARTFEKFLPPLFLGAFDAEKIAFLRYHEIMKVFTQNDFNWNVTPSNHDTKEFQQLHEMVQNTLETESLLFYFDKDSKALQDFIHENFQEGRSDLKGIAINKNNFTSVYYRWAEIVKPTLSVNWEKAKLVNILDADFYIADLFSKNNVTLRTNLYVLLQKNKYELDRKFNSLLGMTQSSFVRFIDDQKAHKQFWNGYIRPPKKEYWDYIVAHRDLLVPQDVRERKGSYFTPRQWVELSQEYIAKALGENWQEEYSVWDCAAGTGNLLAGLTNKFNLWASTIDQADVDIMKDRIENGANLLKPHVFQFDFLNDSFDKLPDGLRQIVNDPEKRKKLLIYINPPYAECGNARTITKTGINKANVAKDNAIYTKYIKQIGTATRELFALFLTRIFMEIPDCKIAQFSTLKAIQSSNFKKFRDIFTAKLEKMLLLPSFTFDNVKGKFPIGFFVWNTEMQRNEKETIIADVYDEFYQFFQQKIIFSVSRKDIITAWLRIFKDDTSERLAYNVHKAPDFQHNKYCFISISPSQGRIDNAETSNITANNLMENTIYLAIRRAIPSTWLNANDQFLFPADTWKEDSQFQTDCLAWTIFNNNISAKHGVNHWIPFTENEVDAQDNFASHFMTDYIQGKLKPEGNHKSSIPTAPLSFSPAAQAVFDAGRELWKYYQSKLDDSQLTPINVNASLYDIKEYFQGRNAQGRMNAKSKDDQYNQLIGNLREKLKTLADQIVPKVYEHGFLKK